MKIRINEKEVYEINLSQHTEKDKEMSFQEFLELTERLNRIAKIFRKDEVFNMPEPVEEKQGTESLEQPKTIRRQRDSRKRIWASKRESVIAVMRLNYYGTMEQKKQWAKMNNEENWEAVSKSFHNLKKRWNIQPKEVGMKRFPTIGEKGIIQELKLN